MHRRRPVSHRRLRPTLWRRARITGIAVMIFLAWTGWYIKLAGHHLSLDRDSIPPNFWGATYSKKYALELGLDWQETYRAILDDLKIRSLRLPIYWDDIEKKEGLFDFSEYDWMLDEAAARGVSVIPVVGRRQPRWPECHEPAWTESLSPTDTDARHLAMSKITIDHLRHRGEIVSWQLENEYFLPWFGECPKANIDLLKEEIAYLRSVDARPILLTESGEFNTWRKASRFSDILGTTMYRVVWNEHLGYMRMPWPAWWYRAKAALIRRPLERAVVAELQAEPWPAQFKKVTEIDTKEASKSFSLQQLETNSELARRTGFTQAYFWGVEWWYWLKVNGDDSFWNEGKNIIQASHET